jgi:hypothetical protein
MFKKAKFKFTEFFQPFPLFWQEVEQRKKNLYFPQASRFDFLGSTQPTRLMLAHIIIKLSSSWKKCLNHAQFEKAFYSTQVNFVNSYCGHTFCLPCFKNENIVSITFFSIYYLSLFLNFFIYRKTVQFALGSFVYPKRKSTCQFITRLTKLLVPSLTHSKTG